MMIQIIISMLATLSFAVIFNAPRKEYLFCAITGAVGWIAYLAFLSFDTGVVIASLWATVVLTLLARILSAVRKIPVTIFLVTGIFTLVPGAGIYYSAYYLIMNELTQFTSKGLETFKIAGAMVLGIVFGLALPQTWFNQLGRITAEWRRKRKEEKNNSIL